jgi:hypothetical protein
MITKIVAQQIEHQLDIMMFIRNYNSLMKSKSKQISKLDF